MKRKLILPLSALLILSGLFWESGSAVVTRALQHQRQILPPVVPVVPVARVTGADPKSDAATLLAAAEQLLTNVQFGGKPYGSFLTEREEQSRLYFALARTQALAGDNKSARATLDLAYPPDQQQNYPLPQRETFIRADRISKAKAQAQWDDWATVEKNLRALWPDNAHHEKQAFYFELAISFIAAGNRERALFCLERLPKGGMKFAIASRLLDAFPDAAPAEKIVREAAMLPVIEGQPGMEQYSARAALLLAAVKRGQFELAGATETLPSQVEERVKLLYAALTAPPSSRRDQFIDLLTASLDQTLADYGTPRWMQNGTEPYFHALTAMALADLRVGRKEAALKRVELLWEKSGGRAAHQQMAQTSLAFLQSAVAIENDREPPLTVDFVFDEARSATDRMGTGERQASLYSQLADVAVNRQQISAAKELIRRSEWSAYLVSQGADRDTRGTLEAPAYLNRIHAQNAVLLARCGDTPAAVTTLSRIPDPEWRVRALIDTAAALVEKTKTSAPPLFAAPVAAPVPPRS